MPAGKIENMHWQCRSPKLGHCIVAIFARSKFCIIQILHNPNTAWSNFHRSNFYRIQFLHNILIIKLKAINRSDFVGSGWHREGGGEKMASGERIDGLKEAQVCQCPANDHLILVHGFVNNASCWSRFLSSQVPTQVDWKVINKKPNKLWLISPVHLMLF